MSIVTKITRKIKLEAQRCLASVKRSDEKRTFDNTLSIVAIVKNEEKYLQEWFEYHLLAGVDHFYMYDNGSTDSTPEIIKKYVEKGVCTYTLFPGIGKQLPAYNDAITRFKNDTKYMAFVDADEFIYSIKDHRSIGDVIDDLLSKDSHAAGVAVNWRVFASSGLKEMPKDGVLKNFVYYGKPGRPGNACVKTIANPREIVVYNQPHYPIYKWGKYSINEDLKKTKGWFNECGEPHTIRINHYFTKSEEEWKIRRSIGKADKTDSNDVRSMEEFHAHDNNDIFDDSMNYFVDLIKGN
ncbi:MAG: glycosyltransferase family 92 protein [Saccharofermentans sp.]|nr:glycosyltransferase family 92 protein [Saccharofermentans sp.]